MAAMMIISRFRRLRSSEEIKEEAVLKRFRFMVFGFYFHTTDFAMTENATEDVRPPWIF
jgi:hypothetical protein